MLHLRVIAPTDLRQPILNVLDREAAVTYIVDTVRELIAPPEEEAADSLSLLSVQKETAAKAEGELGSVTSTTLPNLSKLLSLPTDVESPFKKLVEKLESPDESKLVKTLDLKTEDAAVDETADGGTEAATPVVEVSKPETPKFELPKLDLGLNLTPKTTVKEIAEVKETAAQEESDEKAGSEEKAGTADSADTGAAGKTPNKFAPKSRTTERKKSAGEKFVENATKNLEKAFKPTTKAGADKQEAAKGATAKGASDSDSGAKAGNAHADAKSTKDTKDNKDSKSHKDK